MSITRPAQMSLLEKMRQKQGATAAAPPEPGHSIGNENDPIPAPKKEKKPKQRKCCATMTKTEHLPTCPHMQPPKEKKPKRVWSREIKERLPDGAVYYKSYDAAKQEWRGSLEIPGFPVFEAQASGSWRVENILDGQYRDYLLANKDAPAPGPAAAG